MQVKIKRLKPNAVIPTYAKEGDAGMDLVATEIIKDKFKQGTEYINKWWKKHAISRYTKLHDEGRIKPEHLFYIDAIGISWEEMKAKYLSEVGR